MIKLSKESMLTDLAEVRSIFFDVFPQHKKEITPDFYFMHSTYTKNDVDTLFGNFTKFTKELAKASKKEAITRKSFNIHKNDQDTKYPRKYVVTSAIAGATLQPDLFETLQTVCKDQKAQLVILPMRGIVSTDDEFDKDILNHSNLFCTEYQFNDNLKAQDFMLNPQMINPLTGITRFGQKHISLIVAAPKQFFKCVPVGASSTPHMVHLTGTITMPDYAKTRQGALARQDHTFGALLVEVRDKKTFHIRKLKADANFGVYDINKYYHKNKITACKASAFVMGDLHCGSEDPLAVAAWKECIKLVQPKYIVMHDILDCLTINHHQKKNIMYRALLPKHLRTLEQELDLVSDTLNMWCTEFPKTQFIITKGNHDAWLDTFLQEGEYAKKEHYENHRMSLQLAMDLLDGKNPLKEYVKRKYNIKNITWLDIDSDFKIEGVQCGAHGDRGSNGAKASIRALETQYGNSYTAHTHSPESMRNTDVVGTTTHLKLDYNKGGGSSWLQSSGTIYPGGIKQHIICINGLWKL